MIAVLTTLLFLLLPGLPIAFSLDRIITGYWMEKVIASIAISFTYWIIGFWWLSIVPLPFHIFVYGSIICSVIYFFFTRDAEVGVPWFSRRQGPHKNFVYSLFRQGHDGGSKRQRLPASPKNYGHLISTNVLIFLFFIALAVPYVVLMTKQIAPSGQDMSMHAYLADSISLADGFPHTMKPIVPLNQFGFYPVGFPVILAGLMRVNRLPIYTNALLLSMFTYWFFAIAIFTLLRKKFSVTISAFVTLLASWASPVPNDILWWGANPTVLSIDLLIISMSAFGTKRSSLKVFLSLALFYCAFLVHSIPVAGLIYLLLPQLFLLNGTLFIFIKTTLRNKRLLLFGCLLIFPYLWHFRSFSWNVSTATRVYIQGLHRQDLLTWAGVPFFRVVLSSATFILTSFSHTLLLIYAGSLVVIWFHNRKRVLMHVIGLATLFVLLINAHYWVLPFSALLYPDRIISLELIPISLGIAEALTRLLRTTTRVRYFSTLVLISIVCICIPDITSSYHWFLKSTDISMVTTSDLAAFNWLKSHTTSTDVIMNNYDDAGVWIPAIAERTITLYHTNPIDMDMLHANLLRPTYAFIGAKSVPSNISATVQPKIAAHPEKYELVKVYGNAKIYRLR